MIGTSAGGHRGNLTGNVPYCLLPVQCIPSYTCIVLRLHYLQVGNYYCFFSTHRGYAVARGERTKRKKKKKKSRRRSRKSIEVDELPIDGDSHSLGSALS